MQGGISAEDNVGHLHSSYEYGCLYCHVGGEDRIANELSLANPEIQIIVPKKKIHRRFCGELHEEETILFPGYLFFKAAPDFPVHDLARRPDVYRVLQSGQGIWSLMGNDRAIAEQLFRAGGVIGFSKAYFDGDRIRIMEGFLKDYEGQILRVNKRKCTAQISVEIENRTIAVWLGYETIAPVVFH